MAQRIGLACKVPHPNPCMLNLVSIEGFKRRMEKVSERCAYPVSPRSVVARGRAFGAHGEPFVGSPNSCLSQPVAELLCTRAKLVSTRKGDDERF